MIIETVRIVESSEIFLSVQLRRISFAHRATWLYIACTSSGVYANGAAFARRKYRWEVSNGFTFATVRGPRELST